MGLAFQRQEDWRSGGKERVRDSHSRVSLRNEANVREDGVPTLEGHGEWA
jgi:hypothetical protein